MCQILLLQLRLEIYNGGGYHIFGRQTQHVIKIGTDRI